MYFYSFLKKSPVASLNKTADIVIHTFFITEMNGNPAVENINIFPLDQAYVKVFFSFKYIPSVVVALSEVGVLTSELYDVQWTRIFVCVEFINANQL